MIPGITPIISGASGPTITYLGTYASAGDSATYSTTVDVGTITRPTLLVMGCSGYDDFEAHSFTSASIGGSAATSAVSTGSSGLPMAIYYREVNSGGSTTFSFTVTATSWPLKRGIIHYWKIENYLSSTPTDTDIKSSTASSQVASVDVSAGGVIIAHSVSLNTGGISWTNATERYDSVLDTSTRFSAADNQVFAGATGYNVTSTFGGSASCVLACATWR